MLIANTPANACYNQTETLPTRLVAGEQATEGVLYNSLNDPLTSGTRRLAGGFFFVPGIPPLQFFTFCELTYISALHCAANIVSTDRLKSGVVDDGRVQQAPRSGDTQAAPLCAGTMPE